MLRSAQYRRNLGAGPCLEPTTSAQEQISYFAKLLKGYRNVTEGVNLACWVCRRHVIMSPLCQVEMSP